MPVRSLYGMIVARTRMCAVLIPNATCFVCMDSYCQCGDTTQVTFPSDSSAFLFLFLVRSFTAAIYKVVEIGGVILARVLPDSHHSANTRQSQMYS